MGYFARLNNPFRKFGSGSSRGKDPLPPAPYPTPPSPPTTPEPESPLGALLRRNALASRLAERAGISPTAQDSPVTVVPVDEHRTWRDRRPRLPLRRRGSTAQIQPVPVPEPTPEPESKRAFPTRYAVAAAVGAVALMAAGTVGYVQFGGADDPAPPPATALTEAELAPRGPAPEPAPLPAEEAESAPDSPIDPASAPIGEPEPSLPAELLPEVPAGEPVPGAGALPVPLAEPAPAPALAPAPIAEPIPAPAQAPAPAGFVYKNCAEARAAGAAPILAGTPGFGPHLDSNGDGVGCEAG